MKRILIKYIAILSAALLVSSCEWEPPLFDSANSFIAFPSSSSLTGEAGGVIGIPVVVTADLSAPSVSVTFEFDEASDAVEGEHFNLINSSNTLDVSEGWGYDTIWIEPIDNDIFTGNLSLIINLTSNSQSYPFGVIKSHSLTIIDDEHPLGKWIGTYSVEALSYGNPGVWDESWIVTTDVVDGDISSLSITILSTDYGGPGEAFLATIDPEEMTITIAPGTEVGDIYGNGSTQWYVGDFSYIDTDSPIVGTVEEDGTIKIDEIAAWLSDFSYYWDAFNTTWTLSNKKATRASTPADKFKLQH